MRPSLRVQQGGRGTHGKRRRAVASTSEVKGRVLFELGRHLGMQKEGREARWVVVRNAAMHLA